MPELPNVRKMFKPFPNHTIFEADLAGADAQVVAWEAGDEKLKEAFRKKLPLHLLNAKAIYKDAELQKLPVDKIGDKICKENPRLNKFRHRAKQGVHATNYGCQPPTLSLHIESSVSEAKKFQDQWFSEHPEILEWHERTQQALFQSRTVSNRFGYKRFYFDRVEGLLPQALAWVPQSTVAICINKAWVNICSHLPSVQILLQVHDSLVGQFPTEQFDEIIPQIAKYASITIPYTDPLTISVSIKTSNENWGSCEEVKLPA
jgi:DNA polymerase I-like protein with 3'-5' exonuclease and polymerase domains